MAKRTRRGGVRTRSVAGIDDLAPELRFNVLLRATVQMQKKMLSEDLGIKGVAFGYKETAGELTRQLCVRFYVRKKIVRPGAVRSIPRVLRVRVQHKGVRYAFAVPTDLIEAPGIDRLETHAKRPKLAPSIFHSTNPNEYGTATALVADPSGTRYILSAAHVVACVLRAPPVVLDSLIDSDTKPGVGTLNAYPMVGSSGIDAAVVRPALTSPETLVPRPGDVPVTVECPESELFLQDPGGFTMYSFRRTRSMTLHAVHPNFTVKDVYAEGPVTLPLIFEFQCGAEGGDSGSLVVDAHGRGVGMHIMGMKGESQLGYSVPIRRVLNGVVPGTRFTLAH